MPRGYLIQAPSGSGKSQWLQEQDLLTSTDQVLGSMFFDGDKILARHGTKNRNYFWYQEGHDQEREAIRCVFEEYLKEGHHILYSGHPDLLPTNILILLPSERRWQQLEKRRRVGGWAPSYEKFLHEEETYRKYQMEHPEIPTFTSFEALLEL